MRLHSLFIRAASSLFVALASMTAQAQTPGLVISEYLANPAGTDSPFEYVELVATRTIDFSVTPYTVVFNNNGTATANGWIQGAAITYAFAITSGTVSAGDVVYVGGSTMAPTGTKLRTINTGTTGGDGGIGNANATGIFGNGGANADGIAVFDVAVGSLTNSTAPVDAIFFGTGVGTALVNGGLDGYQLPVNDRYSGGKLQASSFLAGDPANGMPKHATGELNTTTGVWTTARSWADATATDGATTVTLTTGGALPNLSISDVIVNEADSGTTTFVFTVSLDAPAGAGGVSFDIATADDTATTADNDYVANSLTGQTITAGNQTYMFNVTVNGDTTVEPTEIFLVNVTNVTGATVTDGQGQGTIFNDDVTPPNLSINDVSAVETNAGTTTFAFTVSLDAPAGAGGVSFDIATADNTATTADNDYVANNLTGQTIAAGNQTYTFNVTVNGDGVVEPNETFFVNVTNVTGATVTDGQGQGTINNDDVALPNLSIDDVSAVETNAGTTTFAFTVSLDAPAGAGGVSFDIATADNTATTADNDYVANSLTGQTIAAGNQAYTFNVTVNGDDKYELSGQQFFVNVSNIAGANVTDAQGVGTIEDDDNYPSLTATAAVSVGEGNAGNTGAAITYTLSNAADADTTISVDTADGSATLADNDYVQLSGATVVVPAGATSVVYNGASTVGDSTVEPNETFSVAVTDYLVGTTGRAPKGLTLPAPTVVTILNDDASADLSITVVDSPDPVVAGQNLTYVVTLTNAGPSNADGANFSLPLPAGTTFVSLAQPGMWNCTTPAVGANGTVSCNDGVVTAAAPGDAKMGVGSAQFTIVAQVGAGVAPGTVLTSALTSSAFTTDPNGQNNAANATTTVAAAFVPAAPIPALDARALMLMALALFAIAFVTLRRD